MRIPFTRWPDEFARRYREKGYWQDVPLTDILTRHAGSDKTAGGYQRESPPPG